MSGLNRQSIIGYVGNDPAERYKEVGDDKTPVTSFSVAATAVWNNRSGEKQEHTEWFSVDVWGPTAKFVRDYVTKGRQVYVEGETRTRSWEDEKSGETKYRTTVQARRVDLLGPKPAATEAAADDMPF